MSVVQRRIEYLLNSKGLIGIRPIVYQDGERLSEGNTQYDLEEDVADTTGLPVSALGTVVFAPLTLKNETGSLSIRLDTVLLQVNMQKQIITTALQGVNGTVKEYISDGNYSVSITGMLVAENSSFPEEQVSTLHELCLLPEALIVESNFLQLLEIYNLVIQSYSFSDKQGFENVQLFELQCLSDNPIELVIEDETLN